MQSTYGKCERKQKRINVVAKKKSNLCKCIDFYFQSLVYIRIAFFVIFMAFVLVDVYWF